MACSQCGSTKSCGCKDLALTTIPVYKCPPDTRCPNPEPCSEIVDAACIMYTGPDILELGVNYGDRFNTIIQKLILFTTNPTCVDVTSTCQSTSTLALVGLTNTTITIGWALSPTAINYQVEYKASNSNIWLLNTIVGPAITADVITALVPSTSYDVRVNAICNSGNCYSVTFVITTLS